jgi:hypothetical protein
MTMDVEPGTELEDPGSETSAEEELANMADDGRTVLRIPPAEQAELDQTGRALQQTNLDIDDQLDAQVAMEEVEAAGPQPDARVEVAGDVGEQLTRLRNEVQELRNKCIRGADKQKVWYARWKFWSFVTGIVSVTPGTAAFIYLLVVMGKDPTELTEEQKEQIKRQAQRWRDMPDEQYWDAMADYCDRWNPSWTAQILFMDYTQELKPQSECVPAEWTWASGDDQYDFAVQLANAYGDQTDLPRKSGVVYRTLANLKYAGDPSNPGVPVSFSRYVAADTAKLALTYIASAQGPAVPPSD